MILDIIRFFDIFKKLFYTRLYIIRKQIVGKIVNLYMWAFCTLIVMGYVMQHVGLSSDFGNMQLAGIIATIGFFEIYGNTAQNIMDFEGERSIEYYLTLPVSSSVVFLSTICAYACVGTLLSFAILPFGKIILFNKFNLAAISWLKFIIITMLANIFFGMFTFAVTAQVKIMARMGNVWMRFLLPLWLLGGFQFAWMTMYKISPPIAYIILVNPMIYIMEGTKAALLGQEGYISWWICAAMSCFFCIACWYFSFYKIKKHLDFV